MLAEALRRWSTENKLIIEESISGKSHMFILVFIWCKHARTQDKSLKCCVYSKNTVKNQKFIVKHQISPTYNKSILDGIKETVIKVESEGKANVHSSIMEPVSVVQDLDSTFVSKVL